MDIRQFADKYLGNWKPAGKELKVHECPFCGRRRWKFYVNSATGKFFCQSGSCNESGTFIKLQHKFGLKVDFKKSISNEVKADKVLYIPPSEQAKFAMMTDDMYKWWSERGISKETLLYMKVCRKENAIAFPYLQESELKMMKYRDYSFDVRYGTTIKKKLWQESNGTPVLWGIDKIDFEQPVVLCEGEPDMLSWIEAGYKNVVSVPFGTGNMEWIENNFSFLEKINEMYICFDKDEAGRKAEKIVKSRLDTIMNLKKIDLGSYSDPNEALVSEGKDKLIYFYEHAKEYRIDGYHYAENIHVNTELPEVTTFLKTVDTQTGGFKFGDLHIWSAYTGCGKTTFLSQKALNDVANGYKVCYYTGEDSKEDILTKIALQLYGMEGTKEIYNKVTGRYERYPTKESADKIQRDIGKNLIILEDEIILSSEDIKKKMKSALMKDNCRVFIIDNLMQIDIVKKGMESKNELQKNFVRDLVRFARANSIQIHLVAHNKKPDGSATSGKTYDVSGASEIVNLAHMVIGLDRLTQARKEELAEKGIYADGVFNVLKKRKRQGLGGFAFLKIDPDYQIFYDADESEPKKIEIVKKMYGFEGVEITDKDMEVF